MKDFFTDPLITFIIGFCLGVLFTLVAAFIAVQLDKRKAQQ